MNRQFVLLLFAIHVMVMAVKSTAKEADANKQSGDGLVKKESLEKEESAGNPEQPTFKLEYAFGAGERLRWKVEHLVTVETKIQGTSQTAETRSHSTKLWRVTSVDSEKNATFVHLVEDIDMWQKVTGREEISYNSKTDENPPPAYEKPAAAVGIPLSTITLKPDGEILERVDRRKTPRFGGGQMTIPLPPAPIKIGESWTSPYTIPVKRNDGTVVNLKTRQLFTLEKVVAGLATITLKTEVLTPVKDPRIRVQLVQRLLNGKVKFDVDAGRVVAQRMELDETVLAFNGADSSMHYWARFTEELISVGKTAELSDGQDSGTSEPTVQRSVPKIRETKVPKRRQPTFRR